MWISSFAGVRSSGSSSSSESGRLHVCAFGSSGWPGCVVQYSVGSEPCSNISLAVPGHWSVASMPDSVHTVRATVPAGSVKSSTGLPRVAPIMMSVQIGSAARAPVMPRPIVFFSS